MEHRAKGPSFEAVFSTLGGIVLWGAAAGLAWVAFKAITAKPQLKGCNTCTPPSW